VIGDTGIGCEILADSQLAMTWSNARPLTCPLTVHYGPIEQSLKSGKNKDQHVTTNLAKFQPSHKVAAAAAAGVTSSFEVGPFSMYRVSNSDSSRSTLALPPHVLYASKAVWK
jgi:hypothetical protein